MTLDQLLRDGAAPNPTNNTTIAAAQNLTAFLDDLFPVEAIVVNTTTSYPIEAAMVPVRDFEVPADAKLLFQLQVSDGGRDVYIGVANIQAVRRNQGDQQAAIICLEQIVPGWKDQPELAAKVAALLPYVPPVEVIGQPVAAMPDWDNARDAGILGSRVGDHSPDGTKYTSPAGAVWQKGQWLIPFETTWKRVS